jgi:hypothetical protein
MPLTLAQPIAVTISPSEYPYRFTEIVNFRGDFDQSIRPGEVVNPKGVAYHQRMDRLLVSLSPNGGPFESRTQILNSVSLEGDRTRFAAGYQMYRRIESKLAIVPDSGPPVAAGFVPGEIFLGRGPNTQISRLGMNGEVINDLWLDFQFGDGLWGGLCFDTEGDFGGRLIAVESNGTIWLVNADGSFSKFANLELRLEGVTVAPATFGHFAKNIIVGVEGYGDDDPHGGEIHAISRDNEQALLANIGFAAEHVCFIPPSGGTFYQTQLAFDRERENRLLAVSSSQFLNRGGRLIVVNEITGELWEVAYDASKNGYTQQAVGTVPGRWSTSGFNDQGTELEVGCFAIKIPRLPNWSDWTVVPGEFKTDRAPAATADASGDILIFGRNQSNREVYLNSLDRTPLGSKTGDGQSSNLLPDPDGTEREWSGWRPDPERIVTPYALSSSQHNRRVYAFAVRNDGRIAHKFFTPEENESSIQPWADVPGGLLSNTNVSCATVNGRLVLVAINQDRRIYLNELAPGGRYWTGWYEIPGGGKTDVAPAVATFQDELYVFIKGLTSRRILVKARTPDGDWSPWAEVPGNGRTDASITPVATNGQLFVFIKGTDQKPYVNMVSESGTWSGWNMLPNPGVTDTALAPAAQGNRIFLFAKGIDDRQLYVRTTL